MEHHNKQFCTPCFTCNLLTLPQLVQSAGKSEKPFPRGEKTVSCLPPSRSDARFVIDTILAPFSFARAISEWVMDRGKKKRSQKRPMLCPASLCGGCATRHWQLTQPAPAGLGIIMGVAHRRCLLFLALLILSSSVRSSVY